MGCPVCHNTESNIFYNVREMMFDTGDEFKYLLCGNCGCLSIANPPPEIGDYYPNGYYSYSLIINSWNPVKRYLLKAREINCLERRHNLLGCLISFLKPPGTFIKILSEAKVNRSSKILDIGSGNGSSLIPLLNIGLNVTGIDPYINEDFVLNKLSVLKRDLKDIEGSWDLIMFNHSFEHFSDPETTLAKVHTLLESEGKCLIRIPIMPSYVWEKYGTNWIQIDAPRHYYIHSLRSIEILAARTDFRICNIIYDSTPFQFMGSEMYKRNIPRNERDYRLTRDNKIFSCKEIKTFQKLTRYLNSNKLGDQVAIILEKN